MAEGITMIRDVMSVKELAEYLGIALITAYKQVEQGLIPGFKIGGLWKFKKSEIDNWMLEKQELEEFKKLSFGGKIDFVGKKIREGFERAGYTQRDIPRLIAEVRAEKRRVKTRTND